MKQEDINYIYKIDSSIEFGSIIDLLKEELNLKEGKISYFSLEVDDLVEETLLIKELKDKALEVFFEQDDISLIFSDVELDLQENSIEISSKNKLALKGIEVNRIINRKFGTELNLDNLNLRIFCNCAVSKSNFYGLFVYTEKAEVRFLLRPYAILL